MGSYPPTLTNDTICVTLLRCMSETEKLAKTINDVTDTAGNLAAGYLIGVFVVIPVLVAFCAFPKTASIIAVFVIYCWWEMRKKKRRMRQVEEAESAARMETFYNEFPSLRECSIARGGVKIEAALQLGEVQYGLRTGRFQLTDLVWVAGTPSWRPMTQVMTAAFPGEPLTRYGAKITLT